MEGSVDQGYLEIYHGVTSNNSTQGSFLDTIERGFDKFLGNGASYDFVFYLDAFSFFLRFKLDDGMAILSASA